MAYWTLDATSDVQEAWSYIAKENEAAADRIIGRITASGERLSRYARMGRHGREPGTREFSVPRTRYILIYRILANDVEILRVLHSARQWPPEG
jgi:toxin ParE1/3/4